MGRFEERRISYSCVEWPLQLIAEVATMSQLEYAGRPVDLEKLRRKFFELLEKDRQDPGFLACFAEVDRLLSLAVEAERRQREEPHRGWVLGVSRV